MEARTTVLIIYALTESAILNSKLIMLKTTRALRGGRPLGGLSYIYTQYQLHLTRTVPVQYTIYILYIPLSSPPPAATQCCAPRSRCHGGSVSSFHLPTFLNSPVLVLPALPSRPCVRSPLSLPTTHHQTAFSRSLPRATGIHHDPCQVCPLLIQSLRSAPHSQSEPTAQRYELRLRQHRRPRSTGSGYVC